MPVLSLLLFNCNPIFTGVSSTKRFHFERLIVRCHLFTLFFFFYKLFRAACRSIFLSFLVFSFSSTLFFRSFVACCILRCRAIHPAERYRRQCFVAEIDVNFMKLIKRYGSSKENVPRVPKSFGQESWKRISVKFYIEVKENCAGAVHITKLSLGLPLS